LSVKGVVTSAQNACAATKTARFVTPVVFAVDQRVVIRRPVDTQNACDFLELGMQVAVRLHVRNCIVVDAELASCPCRAVRTRSQEVREARFTTPALATPHDCVDARRRRIIGDNGRGICAADRAGGMADYGPG